MHGNMLQAYSHLYKTFAEDIRESDLLRAEMLKERQAAAAKEPKVQNVPLPSDPSDKKASKPQSNNLQAKKPQEEPAKANQVEAGSAAPKERPNQAAAPSAT